MNLFKSFTTLALFSLALEANAFCGFYVGKADTSLYNQASQVVYVRDGERNVVTMASDFKGEVKDFAMVVPVPTVLKREQISIVNNATVQHLDAYSAPRLVEYYDSDPCTPTPVRKAQSMARPRPPMMISPTKRAEDLGVKIEAQYTVGEYDILLLSAKESGGLITWLTEQGYKLPQGAEPVVGSYLKQDMKFFVAKVNLKEQSKTGFSKLRPIRIVYDNKKFMLPIRLGTVNSKGEQELFIYALSRQGRIETTNYRTVKLPSDQEIPEYVKDTKTFSNFYRDMFVRSAQREKNKAVFLEYAWDMNWCDPCAADPLSPSQLKELGVFWAGTQNQNNGGGAQNVYITRLHLRYNRENFPEDLAFQTTGNTENFQGRYIIRHPFKGNATCPAGQNYFSKILPQRQELEAKRLANLTGWDISEIRKNIATKK